MQALLDAIAQLPATGEVGRLFHGRGGHHPGCEDWALDLYPPVCLFTSYAPVDDAVLAQIDAALRARWAHIHPGQALNWVFQHRDEQRTTTRLMSGAVPEPHVVSEAGSQYIVHLLRGQNHGLFLDMAQGRQWVLAHMATHPGAKVLNLFAYTGAFSVVAMQAGARQAINVDMSSGALGLAQQNHRLNGVTQGAGFWAHDVFSTWGKINRSGPYDLVIMDPPTHQKGSFVAEKDYPRLLRRLPELLAPGGHALVCLNSPKLGLDFLLHHLSAQAPEIVCMGRLPNPSAFDDVQPDRALKVLVCALPANATHPTSA